MDVFTIQNGKWRKARDRNILLLDTSVGSNPSSPFTPTWDMVMGIKRGSITEEEYTQMYRDHMNASWKDPKKRETWIGTIESKEPIAIGCMCREGAFCHRHLLKDIFEKLCVHYKIPFMYYGELS